MGTRLCHMKWLTEFCYGSDTNDTGVQMRLKLSRSIKSIILWSEYNEIIELRCTREHLTDEQESNHGEHLK